MPTHGRVMLTIFAFICMWFVGLGIIWLAGATGLRIFWGLSPAMLAFIPLSLSALTAYLIMRNDPIRKGLPRAERIKRTIVFFLALIATAWFIGTGITGWGGLFIALTPFIAIYFTPFLVPLINLLYKKRAIPGYVLVLELAFFMFWMAMGLFATNGAGSYDAGASIYTRNFGGTGLDSANYQLVTLGASLVTLALVVVVAAYQNQQKSAK